jgi:hypothetical protein
LWKSSSNSSSWNIADNMRGFTASGPGGRILNPNNTNAEGNSSGQGINSTGFSLIGSNANWTWIYVAIRRGPMKTPTTGTSVYNAVTRTGNNTDTQVSLGLAPDWVVTQRTDSSSQFFNYSRLRGIDRALFTNLTATETIYSNSLIGFNNTSLTVGIDSSGVINQASWPYIYWAFSRAPKVFDVVCYNGNGANRTIAHNLGVVPELMIVKARTGFESWITYHSSLGNTRAVTLNNDQAPITSSLFWNNTTPTASVFTVSTADGVNSSSYTFVAYLFATLAGVSKVGSYTGTGATLQINCGFTSGTRFVIIKRTDNTGDWYVWDSARGIVSGNDPYYVWNVNYDQVTTTDWVDTYSAGFELSNAAGNNVNINGGTYIFLAFA